MREPGAWVVDVGCGTGHALVLMSRAFPNSQFVGYDIAEDAIARAREEAVEAGADNATFEVRDAATLAVDEPFDLAFVFDAIYDQVAPAAVLSNVHGLFAPGGCS